MSQTVNPSGPIDAKIALVGEAPSFDELEYNAPFVGKAGGQLNYLLTHAGINRSECYITNLFKMRVVKKGDWICEGNTQLYYQKSGKQYFTPEGLVHCLLLQSELEKLSTNVIIPLGGLATHAITGCIGILKWRGSIIPAMNVVGHPKCVPTIHPASVAREYKQRMWVIKDFKRALEESTQPDIILPERNYILGPSFIESKAVLAEYSKCKKISFDIEILNNEISCISLGPTWDNVICIPFVNGRMSYFDQDQETILWNIIGEILEDEKVRKIGQNLAFDIAQIYERYGILTKNYDDTMIAHRIIFPDYPAGLPFITSTRTRLPYYKDEGKSTGWGAYGGTDPEERKKKFWIYSCNDSSVCAETWDSLEEDLIRIGNLETYRVHRDMIEPTIYMGRRGFKVDVEGMAKAKIREQNKIDELQEELNVLVGAELNPRAPKQVATYFYIQKGITPYKNKGKITTDEGALKRIARKGFKEARIMLEMRHLNHNISTYYNVQLKDNRLVCAYNPVTAMGRLSSSKDIFGYGTNLQNQPKKVMNKFFVADEGNLIYRVDLGQADNRSVAYMGPEPRMKKAFEDGTDLHSLTSSMIFDIPYDEIKQMDDEEVMCDIGYGDQTHRYWGKQCNHAFNFNRGYKSFAFEFEIPEKEGKRLLEMYHRIYPGVRKAYHKWIQNKLSTDRTLVNCFGRHYRFVDKWDEPMFRKAYAFPAQSNTADIINRRGMLPMYYDKSRYSHVDLLRQLHDELDFQLPISIGIDEHIRILRQLKGDLEQELTWKFEKWVIPAAFEVGTRMSEMVGINFDNLELQMKGVFDGYRKEDNKGASS